MTACPDRRLMLGALVDGELDAAHAIELESHIAGCAACAAERTSLEGVRTALADPELRPAMPAGLAARVSAAVAEEAERLAPPKPVRRVRAAPWLGGALAGGLAASFALIMAPPFGAPSLATEVVEGHVRALQASHLMDVATSDRHTVKPWFNGKIDFAPPVPDLIDQGFPLAGGRLDYLGGHPAAALVYHRRAHVIDLFVWPQKAAALPRSEKRDGYSLVSWSRGGLAYWAVSDIDVSDLESFRAAFETHAGG